MADRVNVRCIFAQLLILGWAVESCSGWVNAQNISSESQNTPKVQQLCLAHLNSAIATILTQPIWQRSRWGVMIQPLSTQEPLYAQDATRYFIPASVTKLLTTAALLHRLGPDYRIQTTVYGIKPNSGSLTKLSKPTVLQVVGRGDPSLTDRQLTLLAQQLYQQGIQRVDQLWVDDTYMQSNLFNGTWAWEDVQSGDAPAINSLIVNRNVTELRLIPQTVGQPLRLQWVDPMAAQRWRVVNQSKTVPTSAMEVVEVNANPLSSVLTIKAQLRVRAEPEMLEIPVFNPAHAFLERFRNALNQHNIQVIQADVGTPSLPAQREALATVASPPLSTLITSVNQDSDNLFAEALLRILGAHVTPKADDMAKAGTEAVKNALTELGVDPNQYQLADGSGLSRKNLVSPIAISQTLQTMARSPYVTAYQNSLATAGMSGTLKSRFQDTLARGNVQGKTGTLQGTVALAGYVKNPAFQDLVFSILVNQSEQSSATIRQAIDQIVLLLVRLRRC
jgi:D-alanyl-D-alanine carboxypeptidase/D-alanyl-D-alanine-endopeptidase (penicillin-binding protein 4)